MSAEKGWVGDLPPRKQWHRSRASYEADKRAALVKQASEKVCEQHAEALEDLAEHDRN